MGNIDPALLIASLMVASVPILLAAVGELVTERSGVLNLGVEGMMIMGAICGFITAVESGSPLLGFIGGAVGGAALSLLFAVLTQVMQANQVASGLALTLFGLGFSSLLGQRYSGIKPPTTGQVPFGPLSDIPFFGRVLFGHDAMVYVSVLAVAATWAFLRYSRAGLVLRAVGESHDAAHALGYKVVRIRVLAIMFGGAMAGLGGAYISLVRVPQWVDGITSGAGWIALAIVVFASWRPWRALLGAWLFGGISMLQLNLQASGARMPLHLIGYGLGGVLLGAALIAILRGNRFAAAILGGAGALCGLAIAMMSPSGGWYVAVNVGYLSMAPYLVTIAVLVIMSSGKAKASLAAPACLGQNFHAAR